jgi:hypothetical protein
MSRGALLRPAGSLRPADVAALHPRRGRPDPGDGTSVERRHRWRHGAAAHGALPVFVVRDPRALAGDALTIPTHPQERRGAIVAALGTFLKVSWASSC